MSKSRTVGKGAGYNFSACLEIKAEQALFACPD